MVSTLSQDNLFVSSYYTRFKVIWDELVNYKPIPSCSCGICTCGSMAARVEYQEKECTMNFLIGFNESFATVRGQILLMKPLPSLKQVFSLITQEVKQRRVGSNAIAVESAALFSRGTNTSSNKGNYASKYNGKKERPVCSHCGILGHVVDKCYKIHGYPPGCKNKGKGHSANQVSLGSNLDNADSMEELTTIALTSSQCHQLMSILQAHTLGSQGNQDFSLGTHQATTLISQTAAVTKPLPFGVFTLQVLYL